MKKHFPLLAFYLFISIFTKAQNKQFLKKEYIYKGDTLHYRVLFPENYDKTKSYPLVIFLHGSVERGNDNEKQLLFGASLFTDPQNKANYPAIVIFPQCPLSEYWVALDEKKDNTFYFVTTKKPTKSLGLVKRLVDFYRKTEAVDNQRIYLLGISMGGMGTFDLICRYPKTFAAAIPICGGVELERLKKVYKMPIRIYNGASDNIVPPEHSRNAYLNLKAFGSKQVEHFEYSGVDHICWTKAFSEPDFLSWLFSQKK